MFRSAFSRAVVAVAAIGALAFAAACTSSSTPGPAAKIQLKDAWVRSTAGNPDENSAAYMTIDNPGGADRVVGASVATGVARTVELHVTEESGGQMKMRPVASWDVPGAGKLELKPGGNHVMLIGVGKQLKAGDKVQVTVKFEKAGEMSVDAPVKDAAGDRGMEGMPKGN